MTCSKWHRFILSYLYIKLITLCVCVCVCVCVLSQPSLSPQPLSHITTWSHCPQSLNATVLPMFTTPLSLFFSKQFLGSFWRWFWCSIVNKATSYYASPVLLLVCEFIWWLMPRLLCFPLIVNLFKVFLWVLEKYNEYVYFFVYLFLFLWIFELLNVSIMWGCLIYGMVFFFFFF